MDRQQEMVEGLRVVHVRVEILNRLHHSPGDISKHSRNRSTEGTDVIGQGV